MFGRWGSAAVRRYIRDADTKAAEHGLAADITWDAITSEVAKCVKAARRDPRDVALLQRIVREELAQDPAVQSPKPHDIAGSVAIAAADLPPPSPQLHGRLVRGKRCSCVHEVRDASSAWCGFRWSEPHTQSVFVDISTTLPRCKKCSVRRPTA